MNNIQHCIIGFVIIVTLVKCDPLTRFENYQRFYGCGTPQQIPKVNSSSSDYKKGDDVTLSSDSWIVYVRNKNPSANNTDFIMTPGSTGSFISNRHVITSSQTVLTFSDQKLKWALDGSLEFKENCIGGSGYQEINETDLIGNIEVMTGGNQTLRVKKAALLWMCPSPPGDYDQMFVPMLLELEDTIDVKYPCVPIKNTIVDGIEASTYGFEHPINDGNPFVEKLLKLREVTKTEELSNGNDNRWILVPKYFAPYDRGGPLVADIDNKTTIIGVGGNPAHDDNSADTYFYNIHFDKFLTNICEFAGICEVDTSVTETVPPRSSTSVPPPTTTPRVVFVRPTILIPAPPWFGIDDEPLPPVEHNKKPLQGKNLEKEEAPVGDEFDYLDDLFISPDFLISGVEKAVCFVNWILILTVFSLFLQ